MTPALAWAGLTVFVGAGFFFALAEAALFSLGRWRARQLAAEDTHRGALVVELLSRPQDLLATLALGGAFAHAGLLVVGFWMALTGVWPMWPTLISLGLVILFAVEVLPKTLAVRRASQWSLQVAVPVSVFLRLIGPVRGVAQGWIDRVLRTGARSGNATQTGVSDSEYEELLDMATQQGTLAREEKELILEIIKLDQSTAKEAMTPRAQLACVSDELTIDEMIREARAHKHRRLPVYDETPDTIVQVLDTRKLLLHPDTELEDVLETPSFVPETMNLLQLLTSLQRQKRGMAIVLDEFGGTDGIITVEDILEEIVGEIRSEGETEERELQRQGRGRWRVKATMLLDDFRDEYPGLEDVPDIETVGGLLTSRLEIVPTPGQSTVFGGLRLTALVCDERRVLELQVERLKGKGRS